jgi:regulator of sigma E protease
VNTIFAFLFVLGVLVFVHELGHFVAARRLGVRVITFSLGFGP